MTPTKDMVNYYKMFSIIVTLVNFFPFWRWQLGDPDGDNEISLVFEKNDLCSLGKTSLLFIEIVDNYLLLQSFSADAMFIHIGVLKQLSIFELW